MKGMLLASMMLGLMGATQAADIKATNVSIPGYRPLWGIDIIGDIEPGDDIKFRQIAAMQPDSFTVVSLTSRGGDLVAGLNIGEQIHARQFLTRVDGVCTSVCGLIWLADESRAVIEGSKIGFHAAYYTANGRVTPEGNALIGAYLNYLGFSYATIAFLTHASPDSMQWLTSEAAAQYGIRVLILPNYNKTTPDAPDYAAWMLVLLFITIVAALLTTAGYHIRQLVRGI